MTNLKNNLSILQFIENFIYLFFFLMIEIKKKKRLADMLTTPTHLNPDNPIWCVVQISSNEIRHYSNPQHGGVMGLLLHQLLSHSLVGHNSFTIH